MGAVDVAGEGSFNQLRAALDRVLANPDPVEANRQITQAHHELSLLLARRLGADAGANFHTWAVWGSREAGTTIARQDLPGLTGKVAAATGALGAALGVAIGGWRGAMTGALAGAVNGAVATRSLLNKARHHVARGNRIVIDEIGGTTARFVTTFAGDVDGDGDRLARFLAGFRPGASIDGGQDGLRSAFAAYHHAAFEADGARKQQLVFAANCLAVAHEHIRLQHDIAAAMPRPLQRWITRSLLDFRVGPEVLHVARDLEAVDDGAAYPPALCRFSEVEAESVVAALRSGGRREGSLAGSGAADWSSYEQRMNYVVDLFRRGHLSPAVFAAPYDDVNAVGIAGRSSI